MALLVDSPVRVGSGPVIGRGALRLGNVAQVEAGALVRAASLRLAVSLRGLAGIGGQKAARLAMAARAAVLVMGPGRVARGVTIVKDLRRIDVGAARALRGPGESVGEVVHALPGALAGYPLPAGYIGRKLAALAVARGEVVSVSGNDLLVGGRVVIEASGLSVFVVAGGLSKAARALALEAGHMGEGVALAAGEVRDAWLSEQRVLAANYVKKNAKAAAKIEDAQRRAAALADLRFMELRA